MSSDAPASLPEPWTVRRETATSACARLAANPEDATALDPVLQFASDPKWEVRKVVAEALGGFAPEHVKKLLAVMASESNAFVGAAVQRSLSRRSPAASVAPAHEGLLRDELDRIATRHGPDAADAAKDFAEKFTFHHLRAAVHDIRNVITCLQLPTALVEHPEFGKRAQRVRRGLQYLQHLLDMMDSYSVPLDVERRSEELADLVEESVLAAKQQIAREGVDCSTVLIESRVPEGLAVTVARHEMVMSLTNLIKNAIQAHGRGARAGDKGSRSTRPIALKPGSVVIQVTNDPQCVRITITDTGAGLSATDLAQLTQYIPGRTSKKGGSGYGVPLCNRYVRAHGGSLDFNSVEGTGTTATISIPVI